MRALRVMLVEEVALGANYRATVTPLKGGSSLRNLHLKIA